MKTLPSADSNGHLLRKIDQAPPSAKLLGQHTDGSHGGCSVCKAPAHAKKAPVHVQRDGSHGGCSVCGMTVDYHTKDRQLHIELPSNLVGPDELEVVVIVTEDGDESRFGADEEAVAILLRDREADWFLPLEVEEPTRITLELTYSEGSVTGSGTVDVPILP
ncbi:MAG: hypothetical protein QM820_33375 [Minicystis sp.]